MLRAFFIALLVFGTGIPAHAQTTQALTLSVSPEYPRPYQVVTVTPASTLIDLSASTVTFTANGAVVERGTGAKSAQVQLGAPGSRTTITVTAVHNGQTYSAQTVLRPMDVSLVVEPRSTTHPFYKGAALLGSEARVRLVAIADLRTSTGALIPPATLVYTWRSGDKVLESSSGIGKSVLTATAPVRYRDAAITVTVSSQDQSAVGQARTVLAPIDPAVRIYRNDPLLGPWFETALPKSVSMSDTEETFRAVPYFFSTLPTLTWQLNGTQRGTDQDLTVRATGTGAGTAVLTAAAKNTAAGQSANASVTVQFGAQRSLGIFGL